MNLARLITLVFPELLIQYKMLIQTKPLELAGLMFRIHLESDTLRSEFAKEIIEFRGLRQVHALGCGFEISPECLVRVHEMGCMRAGGHVDVALACQGMGCQSGAAWARPPGEDFWGCPWSRRALGQVYHCLEAQLITLWAKWESSGTYQAESYVTVTSTERMEPGARQLTACDLWVLLM